jgi:dTMP kinase
MMTSSSPIRKVSKRPIEFYGDGIPYLKDTEIRGKLIVLEGPDGSGRSTQVESIVSRLEADGHAVLNTGLRRSELIKEGILEAKQRLPVGKRTLALFYAADFVDQLEHKIVPALEAGQIVVADRYIFTLMARSTVRGMSLKWSQDLFGFAVKADLVFYLDVNPYELFHRAFQKSPSLDYYESGADMRLSDDFFSSYILYQMKMAKEFEILTRKYGLIKIDGNRPIPEVNVELQRRIDEYLESA